MTIWKYLNLWPPSTKTIVLWAWLTTKFPTLSKSWWFRASPWAPWGTRVQSQVSADPNLAYRRLIDHLRIILKGWGGRRRIVWLRRALKPRSLLTNKPDTWLNISNRAMFNYRCRDPRANISLSSIKKSSRIWYCKISHRRQLMKDSTAIEQKTEISKSIWI